MGNSKRLRKSLLWTLIGILMSAAFLQSASAYSALRPARGGVQHNGVVTSAKLTQKDLTSPLGEVGNWSQFQLLVEFALPNNQVHEGDTTVIPLPEELRASKQEHFDIKNDKGQVVARAVTDPATKAVTMTYTDFVDKHSDVTGSLHVTVRVDTAVVKEPKTIHTFLDMGAGNPRFDLGTFEFIGIGNGDNPNEKLVKYAWFDDADPTILHYRVRVNGFGGQYRNYVMTDELLTENASYLKDSFVVETGRWKIGANGFFELENKRDVTDQYRPTYAGKGFTINFGDINGEGYSVRYKVKLGHKPVNQEIVRNRVRGRAENTETVEWSTTVTYQESGGQANGYTYTIKLHKESEDGTKLEGVVFTVKRDASGEVVGQITTDRDGVGSVSGLLKDNYTIEETTPPKDHMPLGKAIKITPADFGTDKIAVKRVTNKRIPKIEVSGRKTWEDDNDRDGKRPRSIVVNLLADGKKIKEQTVMPDATGNWSYKFSDLPKYKDGREIRYTVTENTVEGYSTEINGNDLNNRYTPKKTSVTVTKRWNDSNDKDKLRPKSVSVQLYANGEKTGAAVTLDAKNNWTHTWNDLPQKAKGKDIKYTVKEVGSVSGYTAAVDDKDHGNIILTNTHTPGVKTGDTNKLLVGGGILFAAILALIGLSVVRRRDRD